MMFHEYILFQVLLIYTLGLGSLFNPLHNILTMTIMSSFMLAQDVLRIPSCFECCHFFALGIGGMFHEMLHRVKLWTQKSELSFTVFSLLTRKVVSNYLDNGLSKFLPLFVCLANFHLEIYEINRISFFLLFILFFFMSLC